MIVKYKTNYRENEGQYRYPYTTARDLNRCAKAAAVASAIAAVIGDTD